MMPVLYFTNTLVVLILSVNFISPAVSINCDQDPIHAETRLKKLLLCDSYNADLRPVRDTKKSVNISITPILMSYDYDSNDDTFKTNMLLIMQWTDEYLIWDVKKNENISSMVVRTDEIWIPDFNLFSSYDKPDARVSCTSPRCLVRNSGKVTCVPACDFNARCESDYTAWPMDSQRCRLYYGSWMEHSDEVDFDGRNSFLGSQQTNAHLQWRVVSNKVSKQSFAGKNNVSYPSLVYDFVLERHSVFHVAVLLTPIFLLIVLNLFLTWLTTDCLERKVLLAVSMFGHFQFMALLKWTVPHNGESVPGILLFFRNSLIITCALLVHSVVGTWLKRLDRPPPTVVGLLSGTLVRNRVGELILAGDYMNVEYKKSEVLRDVAASTELAQNRTSWVSFSRTLDRLLFLVYLLAYVVFFFMYVPLKYAKLEEYDLNVLSYKDINQID